MIMAELVAAAGVVMSSCAWPSMRCRCGQVGCRPYIDHFASALWLQGFCPSWEPYFDRGGAHSEHFSLGVGLQQCGLQPVRVVRVPAGLFEPGRSPYPPSSLRPHAVDATGLTLVFAVMVFAAAGVLMNVFVPPWAFLMGINDRCGDGLLGGPSSCAWLSRLVMRGSFSRMTSRRTTCCLPPAHGRAGWRWGVYLVMVHRD